MFVVLHRQVIVVPALVVYPVIRCDHVIGVQRGDDVVHYVLLRQTQLARMHPVDIQPDAGIVHILRDIDFTHIMERPEALGQVLRQSKVILHVRAADLHIDRSGHAHIDDRVHHRSALEEGANVRVLCRDGVSDARNVIETTHCMIVVQCYLHGAGILAGIVGIERREIVHYADIGDHHFEIMGAHDLVDQVFHFLYILFGHFDPRAGGDLHIDGKLPGVGLGKKRHAQKWIDRQAKQKYAPQRRNR